MDSSCLPSLGIVCFIVAVIATGLIAGGMLLVSVLVA